MKIAAIDLGTNSFLCLIATVQNGRIVRVHEDLTRLVRIGERVHETRMLQPQALQRAEVAFKEFDQLIASHRCEKVLAVATSAARDVKNSQELIELGLKYNIPIQVISGEDEAELTFNGMAFDRKTNKNLVGIDIGGGSTEVIHRVSGVVTGKSVDVGCVRLTELFISKNPVPENELSDLRRYAREKLSVFSVIECDEAIAVAGTPTALACVAKGTPFIASEIHGTVITRKKVRELVDRLSGLSVEDRLKIPGLDRGRADVIVAGGIILDEIGGILGVEEFTVSIYGARYGLALKLGK